MRSSLLSLLVVATGCGAELQDAWDANEAAVHATRAGAAVIETAQLVGILPKYTCGDPEKVASDDLGPALGARLGKCAVISRGASTDTTDTLDVDFPGGGCRVLGATWTGRVTATVSGGDDRNGVALDFTGMQVNGHAVDARLERISCGDLDIYSVDATARVPATKVTREIDLGFHGTVVDRPGIAFIGTDFYILDGPADVSYGGERVQVVFHEVWWEAGLDGPAKGDLEVVKPDGHRVEVKFGEKDHEMQVSVDGGRFAPVPVP